MSSRLKVKQVIQKLGDSRQSIPDSSSIPSFVENEVAMMLARLREEKSLKPETIRNVNAMLKLHERTCEFVRLLARLDAQNSRDGEQARDKALSALIDSCIRNIKSLEGVKLGRLKKQTQMRREFPIIVTGHPSWSKRAAKTIKELQLSVKIDAAAPESRSKQDLFSQVAYEVLESAMLQKGFDDQEIDFNAQSFDDFATNFTDWKTLKGLANKQLDSLLEDNPELLADLKTQIKTPSDQGNDARLKFRVKERILERLKTQIGGNKA